MTELLQTLQRYKIEGFQQHNRSFQTKRDSETNHKAFKAFKKRTPWLVHLFNARYRCTNKNATGYEYYGGRGIKCNLTNYDAQALWFRDKAWTLIKPSIDRVDSDSDYTYDNCRFINLSENCRKAAQDKKIRRMRKLKG